MVSPVFRYSRLMPLSNYQKLSSYIPYPYLLREKYIILKKERFHSATAFRRANQSLLWLSLFLSGRGEPSEAEFRKAGVGNSQW